VPAKRRDNAAQVHPCQMEDAAPIPHQGQTGIFLKSRLRPAQVLSPCASVFPNPEQLLYTRACSCMHSWSPGLAASHSRTPQQALLRTPRASHSADSKRPRMVEHTPGAARRTVGNRWFDSARPEICGSVDHRSGCQFIKARSEGQGGSRQENVAEPAPLRPGKVLKTMPRFFY